MLLKANPILTKKLKTGMCRPRLRNFKARNRDLVLSDDKGLRGAGRLTDKVIDQLQGHYGGASL